LVDHPEFNTVMTDPAARPEFAVAVDRAAGRALTFTGIQCWTPSF